MKSESMRFDLQVIGSWIRPGSKVLDLGCGRGELLLYLKTSKQVRGTGIELDEARASHCIERGLSVLQGDFWQEVRDYPDHYFDVVVLSQTLQQVMHPRELLRELLRIGNRVIVSFPNFGHWRCRLALLLTGRAPVTEQLPHEWYDTPNIRVITIRDFKRFLRKTAIGLERELAINTHHHDRKGHEVTWMTNLRATYGIMMLRNI